MSNTATMGGNYTAVRAADGTWTIHDLPVFSEVPKGERGNDEEIAEAWMREALANSQRRAAEGYLAPAHINHHDKPTRRAGFFVPTDVRKYRYEGREVWTLFADITGIPDEVYQLIRAKELPYRSVEIIRYEEREIGSLALMADEVPFFRYPLTTVGVEIETPAAASSAAYQTTTFSKPKTPALAYRSSGGKRSAFLFRFNGGNMSEPAPKDSAPVQPDEKTGETKPVEKGGAEAGNGQLAQMFANLDAKLSAILMAVSQGMAGAGASGMAPVAPVSQMKAATEPVKGDAIAVAQYAAKLGVIEAKLAEREKRESEETKFSAALRDLEPRELTKDQKKTLRDFCGQPEAVFKAHVETLKALIPVDPPVIGFGGNTVAATFSDADLPADVKAEFTKGPEAGEKAIALFRAQKAHAAFKDASPGLAKDFTRFSKAEELRQKALAVTPFAGRN